MSLQLKLNGQEKSFEALNPRDSLERLIAALELKSDRIAVEVNGEIAPRGEWPRKTIEDGDRIEVVHFVGGGSTEYLLSDINAQAYSTHGLMQTSSGPVA